MLLLLSVVGSCATATPSVNPFHLTRSAGQIHIEVRNDNFYDATIWAVVSGVRQRKLGVVSGKQNADFTMRWTVARPLQFEIDLLTGNMTCRTDALVVDPGDHLELQITSAFGQVGGCGSGLSAGLVGGTESRSTASK